MSAFEKEHDHPGYSTPSQSGNSKRAIKAFEKSEKLLQK